MNAPYARRRGAIFRHFRRLLLAISMVVVALLLCYAITLARVWLADETEPSPAPRAGENDFSRLSATRTSEVISVPKERSAAERELQGRVREASLAGRRISIAGSRHSTGGYTLLADGLIVNMRAPAFTWVDDVRVENGSATVRVGAGATWEEFLPILDRQGWSVAVMQSNNDFTVGGSISVNCHGWQHNAPPIASTVQSFRLLKSDSVIVECRRGDKATAELFGAVLGGYGLFGIILDVELRVVPNEFYRTERFAVTTGNYVEEFRRLLPRASRESGMAYGRICVAPGPWFLADAQIVRLLRCEGPVTKPDSTRNTLADSPSSAGSSAPPRRLERLVFRASVGSGWGKSWRWGLEKILGEARGIRSRNAILQDPSAWFANRDPAATEILQEYFIPPDRFADFLSRARPVFRRHPEVDLLNITVRNVQDDGDSTLRYAKGEVFGLVMLFHLPCDPAADEAMGGFTRELIQTALDCGGTFYLPYRAHATLEQFQAAYPQCRKFYELKRKYDEQETFQNQFYRNYVRPAGESTVR